LESEQNKLAIIVDRSLNVAKERDKEEARRTNKSDLWIDISIADHRCLTTRQPSRVADAYRRALIRATPFDKDAVRRQLETPGWSQLVKVRNRNSHEDVDVYMYIENDHTRGLAIVASEPREFTIVNIVGSINLEDLPKLQKQFHLPKMSLNPEMPVALSLPAQL